MRPWPSIGSICRASDFSCLSLAVHWSCRGGLGNWRMAARVPCRWRLERAQLHSQQRLGDAGNVLPPHLARRRGQRENGRQSGGDLFAAWRECESGRHFAKSAPRRSELSWWRVTTSVRHSPRRAKRQKRKRCSILPAIPARQERENFPRTWAAALNLAHAAHNRNDDHSALAIIDKARRDYPGNLESA